MALIVEDGTARSDAEAYASAADGDAYHAARGNAAWAAVPDAATKEAALRRATDYMAQAYREAWEGTRYTLAQALDWPRSGVRIPDSPGGTYGLPAYVAINVVPTEVKRACMELALAALSEDLNPALDRATVRERVDVVEVEYDKSSPEFKRYRAVDMLLAPYLSGSDTSAGLVRT